MCFYCANFLKPDLHKIYSIIYGTHEQQTQFSDFNCFKFFGTMHVNAAENFYTIVYVILIFAELQASTTLLSSHLAGIIIAIVTVAVIMALILFAYHKKKSVTKIQFYVNSVATIFQQSFKFYRQFSLSFLLNFWPFSFL